MVNTRMKPRTLIFHHGALGDSVLTWPLLRSLTGDVALATSREKARLAGKVLQSVEAVDGESPDMSRLFAPNAMMEISEAAQSVFAGTTRVISFISDGSDAWAGNIQALCPNAEYYYLRFKAEQAESGQPTAPPLHITEFHRHQLFSQGLSLPQVSVDPRFNMDGEILIHPGSGGRSKCWPPSRFIALVDHLQAIGRPVTMIVGEVELEQGLDAFLHTRNPALSGSGTHQSIVNGCVKSLSCEVVALSSLAELADRLSTASVFIGNDSGPAHLAAQLGIPTIAMFGPTDPRIWGPVGPCVRTIWPGTPTAMDWLPVETVAEAIARF